MYHDCTPSCLDGPLEEIALSGVAYGRLGKISKEPKEPEKEMKIPALSGVAYGSLGKKSKEPKEPEIVPEIGYHDPRHP
ncbi:hypothetical protein OSTOST_02849 [Ostertagia ostertagi]